MTFEWPHPHEIEQAYSREEEKRVPVYVEVHDLIGEKADVLPGNFEKENDGNHAERAYKEQAEVSLLVRREPLQVPVDEGNYHVFRDHGHELCREKMAAVEHGDNHVQERESDAQGSVPSLAELVDGPVHGGMHHIEKEVADDEPVIRECRGQEAAENRLGIRAHAKYQRDGQEKDREDEDVHDHLDDLVELHSVSVAEEPCGTYNENEVAPFAKGVQQDEDSHVWVCRGKLEIDIEAIPPPDLGIAPGRRCLQGQGHMGSDNGHHRDDLQQFNRGIALPFDYCAHWFYSPYW